jgi:nucleotide-binding universal stress UspA family protein
MMKTIIVPTDFSDTSRNAAEYAIAMAKDINASLILFHAYQVPVSVTDVPLVLVSVEDLQKDADARVRSLQRELEQLSGGTIQLYAEAILGDTIDELEKLATRVQPFAIVMGTRGESKMERALFGSTTLTAIRHLTFPVIVVPSEKKYSGIKKIGFACDFKQVVETTPASSIKNFVNEFHASLHVLNVETESSKKEKLKEEQLMLETMLEEVHPQYEMISDENVEEGLNRFEKENNLDLLIAIPKKHKLLDGLFHKSHTRQLVFGSTLPVMCIHE